MTPWMSSLTFMATTNSRAYRAALGWFEGIPTALRTWYGLHSSEAQGPKAQSPIRARVTAQAGGDNVEITRRDALLGSMILWPSGVLPFD